MIALVVLAAIWLPPLLLLVLSVTGQFDRLVTSVRLQVREAGRSLSNHSIDEAADDE